jgi:Phospholipid methyltransferase
MREDRNGRTDEDGNRRARGSGGACVVVPGQGAWARDAHRRDRFSSGDHRFLLWAVARIELGRSFSVRAKTTELVTCGIYAKIRNPVYVFGTVFIAGMILWVGRPIWLLALVIIVPVQISRAHQEAQVLEAKFGDAYRDYRAHTWF